MIATITDVLEAARGRDQAGVRDLWGQLAASVRESKPALYALAQRFERACGASPAQRAKDAAGKSSSGARGKGTT